MAIVAKSVLDARRAVAAAAAAAAAQEEQRSREAPSAVSEAASPSTHRSLPPTEQADASIVRQRRGHATKDENGKWQPTGDYPEGFARPPVKNQFKANGRGGPGRPKGSVSHDTLMQKHLKQKREVSVGGRRQKVSNRELVIMSTVKAAMEGKDKHARSYMLASSERLYPTRDTNENGTSAPALSASDALSIAEYEQELRDQIRAELLEELRRERDGGRGDGR